MRLQQPVTPAKAAPTLPPPRSGTAVLIDLDGPLTRLFPDPAHLVLAHRLGDLAARSGVRVETTTDHVQLLREPAVADPALLRRLVAAATAAEVAAARDARPAPGAADFLDAAVAAGCAVAVVSNNAHEAVWTALKSIGLSDRVQHVAGRRELLIEELKPAPALVHRALRALGCRADDAVFYGDTRSDMLAATAAGVAAVGVSAEPGRVRELTAAGAQTVVPDLGSAPLPARPAPEREHE